MKVADDPAQRDGASRLETAIRNLRQDLNDGGQPMAKATSDGSRSSRTPSHPSHGKLAAGGDGTIRSEGTLPVGMRARGVRAGARVHRVAADDPAG